MVTRPAVVRLALAVVLLPTLAVPAAAQDSALPACPAVFAHGGYPTGPNAWERDQVRQPNNPTALQDYKNKGASGVEADLQLTKNGTKAVMWHNTSTLRLTGSKADVNTLWWNTGSDKLNGRTIEVGPYKGERVHTFREFLDAARRIGMVPLVEIKGEAKQSLLNADPAIRNTGWAEVIAPVRERVATQEIMVYTHDAALKPELTTRFTNAGLAAVIAGGAHRPVWPDTVAWEEPPPSWTGNQASWQAALDKGPRRMATSWPQQMRTWLNGRCTA
ncbi:glycerophosphodiester phosphodiesterase family protein [Kibdelosporangium persicum]|uniref:Glycerophosphoryl diester phosphodiesterase n=1 Tax=Kibdelosporangium persicum TaxID=2698649 RepID=A0ABX2FII1_9PSEU|nr:glycerophosphodiester phosphodiesterase family protein [Kibdelosporangium persicum]NRN70625.1 Glycerophosphoryl diester phosphodiesterase [Kibdelosporangium persicum]